MASDVTVLIAEAELLKALRSDMHIEGRTLAFSSFNLASALESIRTHAPHTVAIESRFARSLPGQAFIGRLEKLVPAGTEIKLVSRAGGHWTMAPLHESPAVAGQPPAGATQVSVNTRRAPRFAVAGPIAAVVDGETTTLVNMSVLGAQVVSKPALRPNQKIKVALPDVDDAVLRFAAHVAWSRFEKPQQEAQYRAGLEFDDATAQALDEYCQRHCSKSPLPLR